MAEILTAFGAALCTALIGVANPTPTECSMAFSNAQPTCDAWFRCPSTMIATPNSMPNTPTDGDCKAVSTYEIFDGRKGATYICTRPASIEWLPDGRWAWKIGEKEAQR